MKHFLLVLCLAAALIPLPGWSENVAPSAPALTSVDLGDPAPLAGATELINGGKGLKLEGYGTMFGLHNTSDQGRFAYTRIHGDFDVIIQVENVTSSTRAYAEGGLMVRRDLNPRGLMFANFVTTNDAATETNHYTCFFRLKEGRSLEPFWDGAIPGFFGAHTMGNPGFGFGDRGWSLDNQPARPFPWVWLRIIRQGDRYSAYQRSGQESDWGKWEKLVEIAVDLGDDPLVGIALSANHHPPVKKGVPGDPTSRSGIVVKRIAGLPGFESVYQ